MPFFYFLHILSAFSIIQITSISELYILVIKIIIIHLYYSVWSLKYFTKTFNFTNNDDDNTFSAVVNVFLYLNIKFVILLY